MTDQPVPQACPSCGKPLASDAVVCVRCGFDKRLGRRLRTLRSMGRALCLPRVSGARSFLVLLACMGITAAIVPMALRLPVWIEAEIVIALWWTIWCVTLALFLYKGWLVTHDFQKPTLSAERPSWWDSFYWTPTPDFGSDNLLVGCLALIVFIIVMPFLLLALAEAAILLGFVMYLLIRGMLAQVANARLRCRGRVGRSLGLGVLWATLYTAPLAGLVWFVHRLRG